MIRQPQLLLLRLSSVQRSGLRGPQHWLGLQGRPEVVSGSGARVLLRRQAQKQALQLPPLLPMVRSELPGLWCFWLCCQYGRSPEWHEPPQLVRHLRVLWGFVLALSCRTSSLGLAAAHTRCRTVTTWLGCWPPWRPSATVTALCSMWLPLPWPLFGSRHKPSSTEKSRVGVLPSCGLALPSSALCVVPEPSGARLWCLDHTCAGSNGDVARVLALKSAIWRHKVGRALQLFCHRMTCCRHQFPCTWHATPETDVQL